MKLITQQNLSCHLFVLQVCFYKSCFAHPYLDVLEHVIIPQSSRFASVLHPSSLHNHVVIPPVESPVCFVFVSLMRSGKMISPRDRRMSCLWGLSLLYAASFLLSSAMADDGVFLNCSTPVTVQARNSVWLNCTISPREGKFNGTRYRWEDGTGTICSDGMQEICSWDNETYVRLFIQDVVKENNYTVKIMGDKGTAESTIQVQVIKNNAKENDSTVVAETAINEAVIKRTRDLQAKMANHEMVILITFIGVIIALGLLYFLFGTRRGRKMLTAVRKEKAQGDYCGLNARDTA
ncbi:uncharacterized protein LOC119212500 [Pungitius pungitius]|uniref:uncharacterized protein LOC119212500 n=1 Tax=Pungitius pungitius TaxID=134920 RepID=UPI002E157FC4